MNKILRQTSSDIFKFQATSMDLCRPFSMNLLRILHPIIVSTRRFCSAFALSFRPSIVLYRENVLSTLLCNIQIPFSIGKHHLSLFDEPGNLALSIFDLQKAQLF